MPRITKTFSYDKAPDKNTCSIYHYKDFESNTEQIPYTDYNTIYPEFNKRFFGDLFSLLEQTGLLEESEIINDSNIGSDKYMQSFTVFGCKFQAYLYSTSGFIMFKDFMPIKNDAWTEEYYNALVSISNISNIDNYTITVNYGQTYLDVYVNKNDTEKYCLFTLIKCHSVDSKYDFVYVSKNVNGISYIGNGSYYNNANGDSSNSTFSVNTYLGHAYCPITNGNLYYFYHHIYFCDKYKISNSLHNALMKYLSTSNNGDYQYRYSRESRHAMQCGPSLFNKDNLFEKYESSNIFNISVNGIKVMRPTACNMNIVFDDLDEVLIGPSDIAILCPGRDYTINNINYYCPGTDDIVYEIKNKSESNYSGTCNRWFFKL